MEDSIASHIITVEIKINLKNRENVVYVVFGMGSVFLQ